MVISQSAEWCAGAVVAVWPAVGGGKGNYYGDGGTRHSKKNGDDGNPLMIYFLFDPPTCKSKAACEFSQKLVKIEVIQLGKYVFMTETLFH